MSRFKVHVEATWPEDFEVTARSFLEARDAAVDRFFSEVDLDVDVEFAREAEE